MKTQAHQQAARFGHPGLSHIGFSEAMLLETIGADLRDRYGDTSLSAQPDDLVRLAALIDERRAAQPSDG